MSEERYFKVEYDEEWYLFDSTTISEQLVKKQAEYGYGVFVNSLSPSEVVDLLNEQQAKIELNQRSVDKREEQISIIKKYCLKFLTDKQFKIIRKALEDE